jgi:CRISPR/Cas system CMR-associated protein Cmr5 small subunit
MIAIKQPVLESALRHLATTTDIFADGKVKKAYPAYVAAMGPALRQAGLLPTLAAYSSAEPGEAKAAKLPVLALLKAMLTDADTGFTSLKDQVPDTTQNLFQIALEDTTDHHRLRRELETATVALKLALRTYPIEE